MSVSQVYSKLLGLYPGEFHRQFGEEMRAVFDQAIAERRRRRGIGLGLFVAREFIGLFAGAARERVFRRGPRSSAEDLTLPSDIAGAERYAALVSRRLIHAIAHHDFEGARRYDQLDRQARALLAQLRSQPN